ncbi:hypothetical protein A2755_01490 [Candidatus Wolfebacteria bacterium RIFCSPHIGHO2_01_FULL_48_22]|uniref:Uncharacterized protein n=2 Tax=Candidatus Wolfeibacteriota TaxID=1752735 RepID=A0A1F8DV01_9BACT|nr:MAG: hypothetical protein A2755_01490 [Candidatus Wolfebacteria bacterium RIFCSPHIGHO2_01_FULL_48_22]OGM93883.1 MAG: hypothetical protein A2935_03295 [Candidatus Wolfebacteria bacterium RIFCSPLOWO2_01_FULL_47_17b]
MAIVIQEERNTGSWFGFSILIVVLVILGVTLYYLFFVQPDILTAVTSRNLQSLEEFSQMQFDPRDVTESEFFKKPKQFVPLTPLGGGNTRPFGVQ